MSFVDQYTFRARVQPALVVVLPLGFVMFALLPGNHFFVTAFFALLGAAGGTAIVAQVGRDRGSKKQPGLWASWGGSSVIRLLRHLHTPGDPKLTPALRQQIENWLGYPLPTREQEQDDPEWADSKYQQVETSLREATRDRARFPLVFAENVNYGFRRNLWGIKPFGPILALVAASFAWALFLLTIWGRPWPDPWWDIVANPDSVAVIRLLVAITDTGFAIFWIFWVNQSWVKKVADAYAERLTESVQTLRNT